MRHLNSTLLLMSCFLLLTTFSLKGYAVNITVDTDAVEIPVITNGNCSFAEALVAAETDTAVDNCPAGSGLDTITLDGTKTYTFAASVEGTANALPDVTTEIIIEGNGATIKRDDAAPAIRFLRVASGARFGLYQASLTNWQISTNVSGSEGGALYSEGTTILRNIKAINNETALNGGFLYVGDGTTLIEDSEFTNNRALNGGAIRIDDDALVTIKRSRFFQNVASGDAGGISNRGSLKVYRSLFVENQAYSNASAIVSGGVSASLKSLKIANSTFFANEQTTGEPGFFAAIGVAGSGATLSIVSSTISGNEGGVLNFSADASLNIQNSIFSNNAGNGGKNCFGNIMSAGGNILDVVPAGCTISPIAGSDQINVMPGLKSFVEDSEAAYKGHFPLSSNSIAIGSGVSSACVDASSTGGFDLTKDQLGIARDIECDSGAIEYVAAPATCSTDPSLCTDDGSDDNGVDDSIDGPTSAPGDSSTGGSPTTGGGAADTSGTSGSSSVASSGGCSLIIN